MLTARRAIRAVVALVLVIVLVAGTLDAQVREAIDLAVGALDVGALDVTELALAVELVFTADDADAAGAEEIILVCGDCAGAETLEVGDHGDLVALAVVFGVDADSALIDFVLVELRWLFGIVDLKVWVSEVERL